MYILDLYSFLDLDLSKTVFLYKYKTKRPKYDSQKKYELSWIIREARVMVMVFNATFSNISSISWWTAL